MPSLLDSFSIDFAALAKDKAAFRKAVLEVQRSTVTDVGRDAELALEAATAVAGLGKLAKSWNRKIYPQNKLADDPVAMIYPKGGARTQGAIRGQAGGPIKAKTGTLAIPTKAAALSLRKQRPTPAEWEAATGLQLIPVKRPGKPTLLIATGVKVGAKSGRVRGATDRQIETGRYSTAVIFVLMPVVHLPGRLSVPGIVRPFAGRLKSTFVQRASAIHP